MFQDSVPSLTDLEQLLFDIKVSRCKKTMLPHFLFDVAAWVEWRNIGEKHSNTGKGMERNSQLRNNLGDSKESVLLQRRI